MGDYEIDQFDIRVARKPANIEINYFESNSSKTN